MKLVLYGVVAGILSALALTRFLATILYGVAATDLPTFAGRRTGSRSGGPGYGHSGMARHTDRPHHGVTSPVSLTPTPQIWDASFSIDCRFHHGGEDVLRGGIVRARELN
jgi:hypothetical protein